MISSSIITALGKAFLSMELFLTQFLWKMAIGEGLENSNSYLVWRLFNGNISRLESSLFNLVPILMTISLAYSGIAILTGLEKEKRHILENSAVGLFLLSFSVYVMKLSLIVSLFAAHGILSMSSGWSYYFSDAYVLSSMGPSGNQAYSEIFFSSIYTISAIGITMSLMLREGILIMLFLLLPLLSVLSFSARGRGILIKLWIVFLEAAFLPVPILLMLYVYINLTGNFFQQMGIIILISAFPAFLSYGSYRIAGSRFSAMPFLMEFGRKNMSSALSINTGPLSVPLQSTLKQLRDTFPEGEMGSLVLEMNGGSGYEDRFDETD